MYLLLNNQSKLYHTQYSLELHFIIGHFWKSVLQFLFINLNICLMEIAELGNDIYSEAIYNFSSEK